MNQADSGEGYSKHPGMGRPPAKHKVIVREALLQIMDSFKLSRRELSERLGVDPKTVDGLVRENNPRSASTDVQIALRSAFPGVQRTVDRGPRVGVTVDSSRISYTTKATMRSEILVAEDIPDLSARAGDLLVIEPTAELGDHGWYLVEIDGEEAIMQAGAAGRDTRTVREAGDDKTLLYLPPLRVTARIVEHVRKL